MKNNGLSIFIILTLFASCSRKSQDQNTDATQYAAPLSYPLNTTGGYILSPVSGDTIIPIINSLGDTVVTGIPIQIFGKEYSSEHLAKPKKLLAGNPQIVRRKSLSKILSQEVNRISVNENNLRKIKRGEGNQAHVHKNSVHETILTGIPLPANGKKVPCQYPHASPAFAPAVKDAAILNIQYMDIDQGMNSSYILSMLEDSRGNIWFGTDGGGASRYDGTSFLHFTVKEGMSHNIIWDILEDHNGHLWFGTDGGGVSYFDGTSFTHFTEKAGMCSETVYCILQDRNLNFWFGTTNGLTFFDGKTFTHFSEKEGLHHPIIQDMAEDSIGNLWLASEGGGIARYDGNGFTHFTKKDGLADDVTRCIISDKHGNIWIGTDGSGLSRYDGQYFTTFSDQDGLLSGVIRCIEQDRNGNLWIGTNDGGVTRYDGSSFTSFSDKEGLSNNSVWSILEDSKGNFWFGTLGGGVSRYDESSFMHFTPENGLGSNYIRFIAEDKNKNLWFGTDDAGVFRFDGHSFAQYTTRENLSSDRVISILEDRNGNLWFGTYLGGVCKYDGESFTHYTVAEGLSHNTIRAIFEDASGAVWFGSIVGGLTRYKEDTFTHFTEKEGFSSNIVNAIHQDTKGHLWFSTKGGGVSRFDGTHFTHFTEKEGLSNNTVFCIYEDLSGRLWFGTDGSGISTFDGKSFTNYTESNGLSNNIVYSFLEDSIGNLWISTESGLNYLEQKKSGEEDIRIHSFGKQDGLKGLDYFINSALLDSRNQAWWGSGKSLVSLDLARFTLSQDAPAIFLRHLEINEEPLDFRNKKSKEGLHIQYDSVAEFENFPIRLELPYHKNHIAFHYSAVDWTAPFKIKYRYRLKGLNEYWSLISDAPKADYRNLPAGTYTFQVQAIGESQKWGTPYDYTFTILPPWWKTWWATLAYGLFAVFLLITFVRYRSRQLKQQNLILEERVADRTTKLEHSIENLKSTQAQLIQSEKMATLGQLTAGIAHEIQNPLNFVNNFSEVNAELIVEMQQEITKGNLDNVKAISTDILDNQEKIIHHGKRADAIVKGMLYHSRNTSGGKEPVDINKLADEYLRLAYHGLRAKDKTFNATMHTNFDDRLGNVNVIPQDIGRVILNILTNAFYAVKEKSSSLSGQDKTYQPVVTVITRMKNISAGRQVAEIKIKDNGNGIPPEVLDKIFQPFFTTKPIGEGTGLGLSLSHDIIKAHNGDLTFTTSKTEGTEFTITLPVA